MLDKYEVEQSRRVSYRESGEPLQCDVEVVERKTKMKTLGEHCCPRTHSLLKELLFKRKMCMQICAMEDVRREKMQKEVKNMSEESKRKGRITPTEQWWISGVLLNYCENDWLDTSWYECMTGWEEWLSDEHEKEKRQQLKASHDKFVEKVVINGGVGASFLHMVTQPTLWRGGIQILEGF